MKKILFLPIAFWAVLATAFAQVPAITDNTLLRMEESNNTFSRTALDLKTYMALSGGGTVTTFSAGNLSPLFTSSVANPTTTPALTFALSNAAANTWFGNSTGSAAAPTYNTAGDITKVDDANVTLTLGGTPTGATLKGVSFTVGWTGSLSATRGGTGQTSYAVGDILYASTTTALSKLAGVATGNAIISGGVGAAPSYGKIGLTTHVSGILPVANGGTNLSAVGSDVTLMGSNGSANIYYTLARTSIAAAIGWSRSGTTLNFNLPPADASNEGLMSTAAQTFAGAKTFNALVTGSAGVEGAATSTQAALTAEGVEGGTHITITSTTTLDHTHNFVQIGTLTAGISINLPACNTTRDGWKYYFQKDGTDNFGATIDPNSTETFTDGASTKVLYSQGTIASCKCRSSDNKWIWIR
jgi:hypothetical protein